MTPDKSPQKQELGPVQNVSFLTRLKRPLMSMRVAAGFPSPAEDYIEGRIDLNEELIRHPAATFYIRVIGDSMEPDICAGEILIVDRQCETKPGDIVIARLGEQTCVKELHIDERGRIVLRSANPDYQPIEIEEEADFEICGKVLWSIKGH